MNRFTLLSILFLIVSCQYADNEIIEDEEKFNISNFDVFSKELNAHLNIPFTNKESKKGEMLLTEESFINSIGESLEGEPGQLTDFYNTYSYYSNPSNLLIDVQLKFNTVQQTYMNELSNKISTSNSIEDGINTLNIEYQAVKNKLLLNQDKEVILLNILLFKEYFAFVKLHPEVVQTNSSKGFWDCMKQTAGKKIARGMVYGAATGAVQGALVGAVGGTVALPGIGTATGAVGGAVFGAA